MKKQIAIVASIIALSSVYTLYASDISSVQNRLPEGNVGIPGSPDTPHRGIRPVVPPRDGNQVCTMEYRPVCTCTITEVNGEKICKRETLRNASNACSVFNTPNSANTEIIAFGACYEKPIPQETSSSNTGGSVCTQEYAPVCGFYPKDDDIDSIPLSKIKNFSNACMAQSQGAIVIANGKCANFQIKNQENNRNNETGTSQDPQKKKIHNMVHTYFSKKQWDAVTKAKKGEELLVLITKKMNNQKVSEKQKALFITLEGTIREYLWNEVYKPYLEKELAQKCKGSENVSGRTPEENPDEEESIESLLTEATQTHTMSLTYTGNNTATFECGGAQQYIKFGVKNNELYYNTIE